MAPAWRRRSPDDGAAALAGLPRPAFRRSGSNSVPGVALLIRFFRDQIRGCSPARGSQVRRGSALLVVLATSWVKELIVV